MSYQTAARRKFGFTCSMCVSGADGVVRETESDGLAQNRGVRASVGD